MVITVLIAGALSGALVGFAAGVLFVFWGERR